jgi:HD-like signal output (HDOD) protein
MSLSSQPGLKTLRRLRTLEQFDDDQIRKLATELTIETAQPGQCLIELGCVENFSFYILEGQITLVAQDGLKSDKTIDAYSLLTPIAQLRPSMYEVIAASTLQYLKIYTDDLTEFSLRSGVDAVSMDVVSIELSDDANKISLEIFQDIMIGKLKLPSLPDIVQKIQSEFNSPSVDVVSIGNIIQADPAITAKLIMIANSALYKGLSHIETLPKAIVRLGLKTVQKQIMIYAVNELFKSVNRSMQTNMQDLWKHSRQVASLSRILARDLGNFDPEQAQLAGLIHDLGEIAILQYAQNHDDLAKDADRLSLVIKSLRPQVTGLLLSNWNFSAEYLAVGEESEDWFRNHQDEADLCDLVLIAQYHAFIGSSLQTQLPAISTLPAFAKLGLSALKPAQIITFMQESRSELEGINALLVS